MCIRVKFIFKMTKNIADVVKSTFIDVFLDQVDGITIPEVDDDTILLETGLDSMGFAILVVELEEKLGYDPFSLSDEAYYPSTFGEFVAFYEKFKS